MKKLLLAIVASLWLCGCASLDKGADPIVVRAEQAETIGFSTLQTFLRLDDANRDFVRTNAPEVHAFAEFLREPVPPIGDRRWVSYVRSLQNVKVAYKEKRAGTNEVITALATLEAALQEAQRGIVSIQK